MQNEHWVDKWKKRDIGFHDDQVNPDLIRYAPELNVAPGDGVFVPLCGKTPDMVWLADQGFRVVGVELSDIACQEFFDTLQVTPTITQPKVMQSGSTPEEGCVKYQHGSITLFCGDYFALRPEDFQGVKAVYDCKALIALSSSMRKRYVAHLFDCLGENISILLLTREGEGDVAPPPYPISPAEVDALYGNHLDVMELMHRNVTDIPERLIGKGYETVIERAYYMKPCAS